MRLQLYVARIKRCFNFHALIFVLGILWAGAMVPGCKTDIQKVREISSKQETQIEKAEEVAVMYSNYGRMQVKIFAPKLLRHLTDEPYTEMPEGVRIFFYNDSMKLESKLTANYGISYDNEDLMKVEDDVVLINAEGEKLNSEELIWDEDGERVYSEKFVKITTEDEIIFGEGFESNPEFTEYTIHKIRGTIQIEDTEEAGEESAS